MNKPLLGVISAIFSIMVSTTLLAVPGHSHRQPEQRLSASKAGDIVMINWEKGEIQIDKKVFNVSDDLIVFDRNNDLLSKVQLRPGQAIQYWLAPSSNAHKKSSEKTVFKIKLMVGSHGSISK